MVLSMNPLEFIHQISIDVLKGLVDVERTMGLFQPGSLKDIVNVGFWSAVNEKAKGEVFVADSIPD